MRKIGAILALAFAAATGGAAPPAPAGRPRGADAAPAWEFGLTLETVSAVGLRDGADRGAVIEGGLGVGRIIALPPGFVRLGAAAHRAHYEAEAEFDGALLGAVEGGYNRVSLSALLVQPGRWTWTALAGAEAAVRDGAALADGLSGTGLLAARTKITHELSLGIGLLARFQFADDPRVLPVPTVEYRWSPAWTLALERGLTLRHRPGGAGPTFFFAQVTPDRRRHRLPDGDTVAPGGVFEDRRVAALAGWEGRPIRGVTARVFAGLAFAREWRVADRDGRRVQEVDLDPAPVAGLELRAGF